MSLPFLTINALLELTKEDESLREASMGIINSKNELCPISLVICNTALAGNKFVLAEDGTPTLVLTTVQEENTESNITSYEDSGFTVLVNEKLRNK